MTIAPCKHGAHEGPLRCDDCRAIAARYLDWLDTRGFIVDVSWTDDDTHACNAAIEWPGTS